MPATRKSYRKNWPYPTAKVGFRPQRGNTDLTNREPLNIQGEPNKIRCGYCGFAGCDTRRDTACPCCGSDNYRVARPY